MLCSVVVSDRTIPFLFCISLFIGSYIAFANKTCQQEARGELLFIVDSSHYMHQLAYKYYVKSYIQDIVRRVTIGPSNMRIGVILFSNQVMMGVDFISDRSKSELLRQIESLPLIGSTHALGDALYEAAYSGFPTNYKIPQVPDNVEDFSSFANDVTNIENHSKKSIPSVVSATRKRVAIVITSELLSKGKFSAEDGAGLLKAASDVVYCIYLNPKNRTIHDFISSADNYSYPLNSWEDLTLDNVDVLQFACPKSDSCLNNLEPVSEVVVSTNSSTSSNDNLTRLAAINARLRQELNALNVELNNVTHINEKLNRKRLQLQHDNDEFQKHYQRQGIQITSLRRTVSDLTDATNDRKVENNQLKRKLLEQGSVLMKLKNNQHKLLLYRNKLIEALRGKLQSNMNNFHIAHKRNLHLQRNMNGIRARFNATQRLYGALQIRMSDCRRRLHEYRSANRLTKQETHLLTMSSVLAKQNIDLVQRQNIRLRKEKVNLNKLIESMQYLFTTKLHKMNERVKYARSRRFVVQERMKILQKRYQQLQQTLDQQEKRLMVKYDTIKHLKFALSGENKTVEQMRMKLATYRSEIEAFQKVNSQLKHRLVIAHNHSSNHLLDELDRGNGSFLSKLQDGYLKVENQVSRLDEKLALQDQELKILRDRLRNDASFPILSLRKGTLAPYTFENLLLGKYITEGVAPLYFSGFKRAWFASPALLQWRTGKYLRVHLVLKTHNRSVVRLEFDSSHSNATNWMKMGNLIHSYPWPIDTVKQTGITHLFSKKTGHFAELLVKGDACDSTVGYLILGDSKGNCFFEKYDGAYFLYTEDLSGKPLLFHNTSIIEATELIVYVTPKLFEEESITKEYQLLFIGSTDDNRGILPIFTGLITSPPDFRPPYHPTVLSSNYSAFPLCHCWYKSPLLKLWTQPGTYYRVHMDLIRPNGSLGVSLVFNSSASTSMNWFQLSNLISVHPWSLEMMKVYQFTSFTMFGYENLNFLIEVVGPTSQTPEGCEQRLAYMYVLDGPNTCFGDVYKKPRIRAVSSDSGIPGKASDMEDYAQLNIWAE